MIMLPPADPITITSFPPASITRVGDIALRGRFRGWMRFATGLPSRCGVNEKSVSWLFSKKPPTRPRPRFTIRRAPKASSMVVVMASAWPHRSSTEMCEVPCSVCSAMGAQLKGSCGAPGLPACTCDITEPWGAIAAARACR